MYIYYLKGQVSLPDNSLGDNFVGNWVEDGYTFLFYKKPSSDFIRRLVDSEDDLTLLDTFEMTYDQWQGEASFPIRVAGFHIVPPWIEKDSVIREKQHGSIPIYLDPGLVFGAGTHPTTRNCLTALKWLTAEYPVKSVLDIGTGGGILTIGAVKLGCQKSVAADINVLAAKTALRNVRLNGLEKNILVVCANACDIIGCRTDLLMANIHYDIMKYLVEQKGFLEKKYFILSGLLGRQAIEISKKLSGLPVSFYEIPDQNGIWHTFFGKVKKSASN